ncbi:MAG: HDOD domain-containing protein [Candidatus Obscuribacterales bacterium]|nr:HDOD domain-containing protein [Steroidobacteraceae bacterium]
MANTESLTPATSVNTNAIAFQFVEQLAKEVSGGRIELPAFPDVAIRVRKALSDDNVGAEKIARVIMSEAGLAARVLALANSAALSRGGKAITDMKMAVNRIGHSNVRTAAMSFAITQLRRAGELKAIAKDLEELWHEATMVAALSHAIATRFKSANPDEAMLVGLLHNVGKIYILARAHHHPMLFQDRAALSIVLRDWHAQVGKAIVENWGFSAHLVAAIGEHEDLERQVEIKTDLTDVLTIASMLAAFLGKEADLELNMQGVKAFTRLGLDNEKCRFIMDDCAEEIAALRSALGD